MGTVSSDDPPETIFEEIAICDERQQYTEEFTELLEDYYLHL